MRLVFNTCIVIYIYYFMHLSTQTIYCSRKLKLVNYLLDPYVLIDNVCIWQFVSKIITTIIFRFNR